MLFKGASMQIGPEKLKESGQETELGAVDLPATFARLTISAGFCSSITSRCQLSYMSQKEMGKNLVFPCLFFLSLSLH